jgi:hypothetical protein
MAYPVGIPVFFGILLYRNHSVLGSKASASHISRDKWWYGDLDTFDFLVDGYRRETFWYELVEFTRKLLMAGGVISHGP